MSIPIRISFVIVLIAVNVLSCKMANFTQDCENEICQTTTLQNQKVKIVKFQRDCGATTGSNTQISIIPINQELENESGNIFIADSDRGKAPTDSNGRIEFEMKLINDYEIEI